MKRRGFTMIELLTVITVLGVLAQLAVLRYVDLRHRAVSVQVISDLEAVRLAAYGRYYENQQWAPDYGDGVTPPELTPFLPGGFKFTRSDYTMDWENLVPPGGGTSGSMQLGVVVTASNPRLATVLAQNLGNKLPFTVLGNTLTYVIIGPDGRF
ncbi:MAG: type II secretion system protein [Gemmatimonadales bacterium]|nr:type II secretion system protein [Gemmatimonadales bacterium]